MTAPPPEEPPDWGDDDAEFPPTLHPAREFTTIVCAALLLLALAAWLIWKLIEWL